MRSRLLVLALLAAPSRSRPCRAPNPRWRRKSASTRSPSRAPRTTLGYLAGPECAGRGTGQPGFDKAAEYMGKRFGELGLKPVPGLDGFFQRAPFFRVSMESAEGRGPKGTLGLNDLFFATPNADVDARGPVVAVRIAPDTRLRDVTPYAGKIVVLVSTSVASGTTSTPEIDAAVRRATSRLAGQDSGAKLVLVAATDLPKNSPVGRRAEPQAGPVPVARVSIRALDRIGLGPNALSSSEPTMTLKAKLKVEKITVSNVVAMLPGSDPVLKDEYVGIGAHLDHLGIQGGVVFPGADDDGSGSTALVEVATAFAKNPVKPKRSILFMAFFGEEMGLLGSQYLTDHPPVDLKRMVAELQMDMVGRDSDGVQNGDAKRVDKASETRDVMRLVGSKRISTELDRIIQEQNAVTGFTFRGDAEDVYTRSDHYNFAKNGIPIAFFFDGFHPDYHQPTDTIEKINWDKLTRTAKLCYLSAFELATRSAAPVKDVPQGSGEDR